MNMQDCMHNILDIYAPFEEPGRGLKTTTKSVQLKIFTHIMPYNISLVYLLFLRTPCNNDSPTSRPDIMTECAAVLL